MGRQDKEAVFLREAGLYGIDELLMAMGKPALEWLLGPGPLADPRGASLVGDPPRIVRWPKKGAQQLWVTLWLTLHFLPDRLYQENEVDWMITRHHVVATVPDLPKLRKEFQRHGLMHRQAGGGGFTVSRSSVRNALS